MERGTQALETIMETTVLGRTGLEISVAGLGAGGHSRLGQLTGKSVKESIDLVKRAVDLGITLIDTSERYGTEEIVGQALADYPGDRVCVSTKAGYLEGDRLRTEKELKESLENSLRRLKRETVDIYHIHALAPNWYEQARDRFYPVLERMKQAGKIRFIGLTEASGRDLSHTTLEKAADDGFWDVVMVAFNILNPSARRLLPRLHKKGIGTLNMVAVRRALQDLQSLQPHLEDMADKGLIDLESIEKNNPFTKGLESSICQNLSEMAYRFCRHEPGIDVVLTGTGSQPHLEQNVESIQGPELPDSIRNRLQELFG